MKARLNLWINVLNALNDYGSGGHGIECFAHRLLYSMGALTGVGLLTQIGNKPLNETELIDLFIAWALLQGIALMIQLLYESIVPVPDIHDYAADINYRLEHVEELLESYTAP